MTKVSKPLPANDNTILEDTADQIFLSPIQQPGSCLDRSSDLLLLVSQKQSHNSLLTRATNILMYLIFKYLWDL